MIKVEKMKKIIVLCLMALLPVSQMKSIDVLNFGDSVAAGAKSNKLTYAQMVVDILGGKVLASPATPGHKLADIRKQIEVTIRTPYCPDVVFLEGSLNDMMGPSKTGKGKKQYTVESFNSEGITLGEFKPFDYSIPTGTDLSLTGQVEYIIYTIKKNYPNAIPIWVLTHRTARRNAELQEVCYERIIACAKKWNVVVVDIFHEGTLNGMLVSLCPGMTDAHAKEKGAGTHPTKLGYEKYYVPMLIDAVNKYYRH